MSEIIEDEVRAPTLAYVAKLEARIEALEAALRLAVDCTLFDEAADRIEALEAALREIDETIERIVRAALDQSSPPSATE